MVTVLKKGSSKKQLAQILNKIRESVKYKGFNAHQYCGKLKLNEDSLLIQKSMRDEWN